PTILIPETRKFLEEAIHEAQFKNVIISVRSEGDERPDLGLSFRYDETEKRVVYEPVKLVQEFRDYGQMSPWEGATYILPGDEKVPSVPGAKGS
ncbi:MAG: hypothetical protein AAFZ09_17270, partial [Pseudomonadota bacterium]